MAATSELSSLIEYRCVQAQHLRANADDRVFVHSDGWAYCPAGRAAQNHTLIPTGGLERRRLEGGTIIQRNR